MMANVKMFGPGVLAMPGGGRTAVGPSAPLLADPRKVGPSAGARKTAVGVIRVNTVETVLASDGIVLAEAVESKRVLKTARKKPRRCILGSR